ncbi:MAG: molybdenum cofactor biosynthesis protein MoaE [Mycobacteriales bacterium]
MSRVALARMSGEPLDARDCLAAVADERAGGVGVFVGVVRSDDHGKGVTSLSYEAHPTADRVLAEVCARAATGDVIAVAAEHRTGDLVVGDLAVVVAVSAVHRGEALEATHRLIDAVKTEVPIWKHQLFVDGTTEWVGISC